MTCDTAPEAKKQAPACNPTTSSLTIKRTWHRESARSREDALPCTLTAAHEVNFLLLWFTAGELGG